MRKLDTVHALASLFTPAIASAAVIAWQDDVIVRGTALGSDQPESFIWPLLDHGSTPLDASAFGLPEAASKGR